MHRTPKQAFTLLEISIAMVLTGILLSTLWKTYFHWTLVQQQIQKASEHLHRTLYAELRLQHVMKQFDTPPPKDQKTFLFTPQELMQDLPTLCLCYVNEIDPEMTFNGLVRSLLYVNEKRQLCLATWNAEQEARVEVLLDAISSLEFSFFDPQLHLWETQWPESYDHLPLWMRLTVKTPKEEEQLFFQVCHPFDPILYIEPLTPS